RKAVFGSDLVFRDIDVAGTLSFDGAAIAKSFEAANVAADDLRLSLRLVERVPRSGQAALLHQVETSAKRRNDFGAANGAYYRLQILRSDGYTWPLRFLDVVFYRGV